MSDPLASTLVVLPLIVVGLWAVERRLRRDGLLVGGSVMNVFELAALAVLVLVVVGRQSLGLGADSPGGEPFLAAGLALLLALHVVRLLPALGETLGSAPNRRPAWPFFWLPLMVFVAILPWSAGQREPDGDEPYFLLITHSLAWDFDTDLANNYADQDSQSFLSRVLEPSWADPRPQQGRIYSRHSPMLPLLLVPGYRLAGRWGAMLTMAAIAALVAWLGCHLLVRTWGREHSREIVGAWALLALTPPLLLYSHQIWTELPAAAIVLLALHLIRDLEEGRGNRRRRKWALMLATLLLPLLKLRFAVLAVSVLVLAWWRTSRSLRVLVILGVAVVVVLGGILFFNQIVYDNPFKDHTLDQLLRIQGRSPAEYVDGMSGLFWDGAFGLLAANPLWLVLVPASALAIWSRSPVLVDVAVCALPYLLLIAPRREWYGAWSPPFRFGMALLPLLALLLVPLLRRREAAGARASLAGLALVALVLGLLWVAVPGWTYNLATGTSHLTDHLSIDLGADVGRFFPSMVRPRLATWLWPPLVALLAVLLWWHPRRWPRPSTPWAATLLLLVLAALPLAATRVPTDRIEFEDRHVIKLGGRLYPDIWVPNRPSFRGGWLLEPGDSLRAPIVAGGDRVSIGIDLRAAAPRGSLQLAVRAGEQGIAELDLSAVRGFQTIRVDRVDWPVGADLTLQLMKSDSQSGGQTVLVDRAVLAWE